jgi:hypothetical protein
MEQRGRRATKEAKARMGRPDRRATPAPKATKDTRAIKETQGQKATRVIAAIKATKATPAPILPSPVRRVIKVIREITAPPARKEMTERLVHRAMTVRPERKEIKATKETSAPIQRFPVLKATKDIKARKVPPVRKATREMPALLERKETRAIKA